MVLGLIFILVLLLIYNVPSFGNALILTHIYKDKESWFWICLEKELLKNNHTLIQHNGVNS